MSPSPGPELLESDRHGRVAGPTAPSPSPRSHPATVGVGPRIDVSRPGEVTLDLRDPSLHLRPDEGLLGASTLERAAKRLVDLVVATLAILVLSPLCLAAAVAVKVTSPGPVFYIQRRVGKDGREFGFAKFRTMVVSADEERLALAERNECEGPIFKIRADPRVTPVGRLLRKYSIDELPQLIHVITGQMSIVGPRPPLPQEVEQYGAWEMQRLLVKPGITCLWQVSGRSDLDFETWVSLDVDYIRRWRPNLDLEIIARTVPAVVSGRGAY